MPSYVPIIPDGSAAGQLIPIAATSSPGTKLHDSVIGTAHLDEVFIYVCNTTAADIQVTIEIEGTTAGDTVVDTIPSKAGFVLMLPGIRVQDTSDIDAFGSATGCNALVIVNRILITEALTGA